MGGGDGRTESLPGITVEKRRGLSVVLLVLLSVVRVAFWVLGTFGEYGM